MERERERRRKLTIKCFYRLYIPFKHNMMDIFSLLNILMTNNLSTMYEVLKYIKILRSNHYILSTRMHLPILKNIVLEFHTIFSFIASISNL